MFFQDSSLRLMDSFAQPSGGGGGAGVGRVQRGEGGIRHIAGEGRGGPFCLLACVSILNN